MGMRIMRAATYGNKAYQAQRAAIWHGVSDATFAAMHPEKRNHLIRKWRLEAFMRDDAPTKWHPETH